MIKVGEEAFSSFLPLERSRFALRRISSFYAKLGCFHIYQSVIEFVKNVNFPICRNGSPEVVAASDLDSAPTVDTRIHTTGVELLKQS